MAAILTLTPNPAIDLTTTVARVVPFQKLRCTDARRDPGGGGINVARALARWGCEVTAVFPAGGPTGDSLKALMRQEALAFQAVPAIADTREDFTVFESETGRQYRFVQPGTALRDDEWDALLASISARAPPPGYVVLSGSLPPGSQADIAVRLVRTTKAVGAKPVVDSSGAALKAALAEGVFLVKPNLRELSELAARPLNDLPARIGACRQLVATGRAALVALTLAEQGAVAVTSDAAWLAKAPTVEPVSTVGAGDSFLAAMLWRLAAGCDIADALRHGVAAGTAALLAPGTELCQPRDVEQLLHEVELSAIAVS